MQSIVDPLVMFYKHQNEMLLKLLKAREDEVIALREERDLLRERTDQLENFADEQEQRANALHDVIDVMIERQTYGNVRRDLIEAFNEVANELDIELELYDVIDLTSDDE